MKEGQHFLRSSTLEKAPQRTVAFPAALAHVAEEAPTSLLNVVAAAVDPLEIAASLETCGMSNAVVRKRFGQRDVFSLAEQLYAGVEFRPVPAKDLRARRPGGLPDLGRGVVFATPTLMFAGAAIALHSWLSWWTVPLALICGWAFSQFVAYMGFSHQGIDESTGATVVWALLAAFTTCACLGVVGDVILGGRYTGVLFAAAACAFMTASAELVVHAEERLIGIMLIPGAVGSLIFITGEPFAMPIGVAVGLAAISVVGTVLAALRHVPARWWQFPALTRADFPTAGRYFANGCCCGLFVALLMVLEPSKSGSPNWPAGAAYPMILSLGVMEWQVRSLRAGARRAALGSYSLVEFAKTMRKKLARAILFYAAALGVLTISVEALGYARGVIVPPSLMVASTCLAIAFFLALVVASCGRVDLVLRAWVAGIAIYGGLLVKARLTSPGPALGTAELAFCIASSTAVVSLVIAARRAVLNPFCHA
jgi:hypothetical protein